MPKVNWIPNFVRRAARRIAIRLADKREVEGIQLVNLVLGEGGNTVLDDVAHAIRLVGQYDPIGLRRMRRDVRYVLVTAAPGSAGEFWEDIRSILLDAANARRQTEEAVAMVLVHEAMHARLWRMGMGRHPDRARIERICVRAEVAFARRIPGTERLIEGAETKLATRYWEFPARKMPKPM